ncbi:MAG: hypothetical protein QOJ86_1158, partial [Bradyrhizobium sp.]|nr:hypothetical protein [Bradyrhizobium sp.]
VPANAGTHSLRRSVLATPLQQPRETPITVVMGPAFAGTTGEISPDD